MFPAASFSTESRNHLNILNDFYCWLQPAFVNQLDHLFEIAFRHNNSFNLPAQPATYKRSNRAGSGLLIIKTVECPRLPRGQQHLLP